MSLGVRHAGQIRRFLGRDDAPPAPAPVVTAAAPAAAGRRISSGLWRHAIGLGFGLYRFLLRHRRRFSGVVGALSRRTARLTSEAGPGAWLLRLAAAQIEAGRGGLARPLLRLVEFGLLLAIQIHLGASHKVSAGRMARLLNLLFRRKIRSRRGLAANAYFATLSYCGFYERTAAEVPAPEAIDSDALNLSIGIAHMLCLHDAEARFFLERAARSGSAPVERKLGCAHLLAGRFDDAARCFAQAVAAEPQMAMAHQNYAGFYNAAAYRPSPWELEHAGELLIYDNFMQLAEGFYHQGRYDDTFRCYRFALQFQARFAERWPLPEALRSRIAGQCPAFDPAKPVRLLGYEWVTLIGHFGFLDCYILMSKLGMIGPANYVLLAPDGKVANRALLELFEPFFCMVRDPALVDDLLPYQRSIGEQFMAFQAAGDLAEPWPHAAARAHVAGAERKLGPAVALPAEAMARGRAALRGAGVPNGAWFVGLHIREGGFHGDGAGSTRAHRSSDIDSYLPAVREIIARGGWVVRLGDPSMSRFPAMPGVFDYARSAIKSAEMDVFLLAAADLFIGTTSGLTSAVQMFRKPMLLVNCISNDAQYWTDRTSFIVKPVFDTRRKRYLSLAETYRQPVQARLIDGAVMQRHGLEVHANSAEDIRVATVEKLEALRGAAALSNEDAAALAAYRTALAGNPFMFGAAQPSPGFLQAHPDWMAPSA